MRSLPRRRPTQCSLRFARTVRECRFARGGLEQLHADISCSSRSNWSRLRDLSACSCAFTAFLSTFPHGFAFVFSALRRASRAQLGTGTTHLRSESRAARQQECAGPAQFKTFVTQPDAVPHHDRIFVQTQCGIETTSVNTPSTPRYIAQLSDLKLSFHPPLSYRTLVYS